LQAQKQYSHLTHPAALSTLGGVDLVVSHSGIYVVEINPRPTAPVIALASCTNYHLGEKIIKAAFKQRVSNPLFSKSVSFHA
jgi:predicted ATP-grasp superfamily ATP-dependent carboligase